MGKLEWEIRLRLHRLCNKLSYKNRRRLEYFLKNILRDKLHIYFDGLKICYIIGRQEFKEIDDDRYYNMLELYVVNIFTRRKYHISDFE